MTKGEKIKAAREAKGITQEELGRICGVSRQTIYKYDQGLITNIPSDKAAFNHPSKNRLGIF